MIIALSGPSSCGKTTLLNSLKQENLPVKILDHQYARELLNKKGWSVKEHLNTPENIRLFQEQLLEYKRSIEEPLFDSKEVFLVERSFVDLCVFYHLYARQFPLEDFNIDEYDSQCIQLSKRYRSIIYLKHTPFIDDDSIRIVDRTHLLRQQFLFHYLFLDGKFPSFFILEDKTLESRKKSLISLISILTN